jgi:sugar phosphate isomerase/epimerase
MVIAHAKDRTTDFKPCAAGKGILDFAYYLRQLKQIGFAGPLIMHGLDEEEVPFSRDFLRRGLARKNHPLSEAIRQPPDGLESS